jgi:hypothetical protein
LEAGCSGLAVGAVIVASVVAIAAQQPVRAWESAGPPMMPAPYNDDEQFVQTRNYLTNDFTDETSLKGADEHLYLIERFTRVLRTR